jgi:hypothetical protein
MAAVAIAAAALGACGGGKQATTTTTASVLNSPSEKVTFADVDAAIAALYEQRPAIRTFVVRDVEYNDATRAKVLDVCHRGGIELEVAALESSRVAGCAPLIYFFYSFGRERNAPEAVDVARKLYWYAVDNIHGPFDARTTLDSLLHAWSVG